jgi:hypothetical protein
MKNKYLTILLWFITIFAYHGLMNCLVAGAARSSGFNWLATLLLAAFSTSAISTIIILNLKGIIKNE